MFRKQQISILHTFLFISSSFGNCKDVENSALHLRNKVHLKMQLNSRYIVDYNLFYSNITVFTQFCYEKQT